MEIPYRCDMLIDQDRYIGEDPVGRKCSNEAKWEVNNVLFCDACKEMLLHEPHRLMHGPFVGKYYQEGLMKSTIERLKENIKGLEERRGKR